MLHAYGAHLDVICHVGIGAGPIACFAHLYLHLFHPLLGSVDVCKGAVNGFWGNSDAV